MTVARNSHCSYCGAVYAPDAPWPRLCAACGNTTYINPLPVAVLLVPVQESLLLVERTDSRGVYALPGGYINAGESWQEAGAREVYEETGVIVDVNQVRLFDTKSAPDGTLLVFGLVSPPLSAIPEITEELTDLSNEVLGLSIQDFRTLHDQEINFAFPLHQEVALRWAKEIHDSQPQAYDNDPEA